jgi:LDH2 family malate/lactate/ureidoglycolate dehydrogenase
MQCDYKLVSSQVEAILTAWGMADEDVKTIAQVIIETDLRGIDSHGISMLPLYSTMRSAGQLNTNAKPKVLRETATTALIDGDAGLGHAVSIQAMNLAVEKCRASGCAAVSVVNSHHFGAAGIYAEVAAKQGVIGLVATSTRFITMVPTFGAEPVLGTNPIAFAAPAKRNPPVLLDMATTSVAAGKVKTYWLNDKPLPEGWVVDGAGKAVTDSAVAREIIFERPDGGLTPLGGTRLNGSHKGYGLALMVHILGGVLSGGSFSPLRKLTAKPGDSDNIGHFFLSIDPGAFRPEGEFENDLDAVIDVLRQTRPADPAQNVLVAGDPERLMREERMRDGIPVPSKLYDQLREVAAASGAPFLLEPAHTT